MNKPAVTAGEAVTNWQPVLDEAGRGDVEITRVDAEPLLLTRRSVHARRALLTQMTVAIAAASTGPSAIPLPDRLLEQLPWMRHLTASERDAMADELRSEALAGGSATPDAWPFADALLAWHATAHAKAAGYTPDAELDWYA